MSAEPWTRMSADELIAAFVRLAQALRSVWTFWAKIPENTPERQAMDQELRAIAAELCARKPIEKIRPLFDHESVDVRFYAAMRFLPVDPDWAIAAISAHTADLSTKEVIELCARANERPPAFRPLQRHVDGPTRRAIRGCRDSQLCDAISRRRIRAV